MNKNLTELVFIIDKSGSMSGLEKDTIGGFNSLIEKQKRNQEMQLYQQYYLVMLLMLSMID